MKDKTLDNYFRRLMHHRFIIALLLALNCAAFSSHAANLQNLRAEGIAYSITSGQTVYRELHHWQEYRHTIEYRDNKSRFIASNELNYENSLWSPAYSQQDFRSGVVQGGSWQQQNFLLYRQQADGDRKSITVKPGQDLVISSGFDAFVRQHWDQLQEGQRMVIRFALPSALRVIKLSVQQTPCQRLSLDSPRVDELVQGKQTSCFVVAPNNMLYRLLSKPIQLVYGENRRLLVYRGLSNLKNDSGRSQLVEIQYRYSAGSPTPTALLTPQAEPAAEVRSVPQPGPVFTL